ncbi:MFS-type transporter SLC18B1 [Amphibalanus amphitrite]|uniref:MFS-type transporter SLC18B1 n=1 Tax=Amphibalanus amphitrite TaxID=1232801 RepID=A0A6A4VE69_AMPAM|nr:MFS-type transporter SLC18B1 [Amphibalanus amphitrite]
MVTKTATGSRHVSKVGVDEAGDKDSLCKSADNVSGPASYGSTASSHCSLESSAPLLDTGAPLADTSAPLADRAAQPAPLSRHQIRLLLGLAAISFLNGSMSGVVMLFFPVEAARRGVSLTAISGAFSSAALGQVLLYPLVGPLALRVGVTRLFNCSAAAAGVSTVAFGLLFYIRDDTGFLAACYAMRMVEAVGRSTASACAFTIIANRLSQRASSAVALMTAAETAGLTVTPALGQQSCTRWPAPGCRFYVTGGALTLMSLVNVKLIPNVEREDDSSGDLLCSVRLFVSSRENWLCMLIVFSYAMTLMVLASSTAPYADAALGITPATFGLYLSVANGAHVAISFVWARLVERAANPYPVMALSLLLEAVSQLLTPPAPFLGLQPSWWLFGLGLTLVQASIGGAFIPCFELMLAGMLRAGLPDDLRTHALTSSVFWSLNSLGKIVGSLLAGLLMDAFGFPVMMTIVAAETGLVMLLTAAQAALKARQLTRSKK